MPDCGGNDYFRLEGINDGRYLQFALQTVENYNTSRKRAQLVRGPKLPHELGNYLDILLGLRSFRDVWGEIGIRQGA